jgi:small subunit ribosomal protein S3
MGQKVNPIGFRVGITEDWKSRWYAPKAAYGDFLVEDQKLRKLIDGRLNRRPPFAAISDILIERTREEVTITLKTARPGLVIGPKGAEVEKLRGELEDLIKRRVAPIKVIEIKNPDLNAQLVAEAIAEQLKKRASFRRVLKQRMEATMQAGAKGVKINVSGRLGGAEIARSEKATTGSVPLTTLQADISYGYAIAFTTYGTIGVKTWIYRGLYGEEVLETDVRPGGPVQRRGRR